MKFLGPATELDGDVGPPPRPGHPPRSTGSVATRLRWSGSPTSASRCGWTCSWPGADRRGSSSAGARPPSSIWLPADQVWVTRTERRDREPPGGHLLGPARRGPSPTVGTGVDHHLRSRYGVGRTSDRISPCTSPPRSTTRSGPCAPWPTPTSARSPPSRWPGPGPAGQVPREHPQRHAPGRPAPQPAGRRGRLPAVPAGRRRSPWPT